MIHVQSIDSDTGLATKNTQYPTDIYYPCYSPRILTYLLNKGFKPYTTFVNIKTLKTCHIFVKGEELNSCISEVSNMDTKYSERGK